MAWSARIFRVALNSISRHLTFHTALLAWACVVASAVTYGVWLGYGGRRFVIGFGVAAILFAFELFLATPSISAQAQAVLERLGRPFAVVLPLVCGILYALGVTGEAYQEFAAKCRQLSDSNFVVLPGIEFRCEEGIEIAGVGLWEFMEGERVTTIVPQIRSRGGYAIWVHPKKRGYKFDRLLDCDAVEVLNAKVDGAIAPDFDLLDRTCNASELRGGLSRHVIFGLDLHNLEQPRDVWIECAIKKLEPDEILESLRAGRYWSCVPQGRVSGTGEMDRFTRARLKLLRWAYLKWNSGRARIPDSVRPAVESLGRPFIKSIKRR